MPARFFDFDAALPDHLYWDASFIVHATYPGGRYHERCRAFLDRLSEIEQTLSYISTLALDETIFALIQLKLAGKRSGVSFIKHRARREHGEDALLTTFLVARRPAMVSPRPPCALW